MRVGTVKYLFVLLGAVSLVAAASSAINTRAFVAEATRVDGMVIDLVRRTSGDSITYAPVVRFVTTNGEAIEFRSDTASDPPRYTRGERVGVLYRALSPHDARIDDFLSLWAASVMFGAIGAIFFGIGATWIGWSIALERKDVDLKRRGKRLATTVQRVEMNANVTVQGLHPYRVFTQWRDPGTSSAVVFESEYVWLDPTPYLDGRSVTVFIDPLDPSRYYVDLEFVELRANQQAARAAVASSATRQAAQRVS
jgi:Protein of unknown function (DUF3592)